MTKIQNTIEKETKAAVQVAGIWLPKSQITIKKDVIEVPDWLYKKSGLNEYTEIYRIGNKEYRRIYLDGKFSEALYLDNNNVVASFNEEEDKEQMENILKMDTEKEVRGILPLTQTIKKVYNKSEIMKRAWILAREAQVKFGGKVREYLSSTMKEAWAEAKA